MSKCGFGEFDKTRQRNQFTRHERDHLLCIMNEFSEKLEDKNLSILARKEIWTKIDRKFHDGGFTDRTTAQLKKYWQNYKYHNGRNKWKKENAAMEIDILSKSSKTPSNSSVFIPKFVTESHIDANKESKSVKKIYQDKSDMSIDSIKQPAVVISDTDVTGSSVTVSVIHSKSVKRKHLSDTKKNQLNYEDDKILNNEMTLNPTKKLKGKCLLMQPRKLKKFELSTDINDNDEKHLTNRKIDHSQSTKSLQSPKKNDDSIKNNEQLIRNERPFVPFIPPNSYPGQFNVPINFDNHLDYQGNNFQYQNIQFIRQLQLLRHLEVEEHRLKVKLAEMSLKETHLKIQHLREECESTQMKFTI